MAFSHSLLPVFTRKVLGSPIFSTHLDRHPIDSHLRLVGVEEEAEESAEPGGLVVLQLLRPSPWVVFGVLGLGAQASPRKMYWRPWSKEKERNTSLTSLTCSKETYP